MTSFNHVLCHLFIVVFISFTTHVMVCNFINAFYRDMDYLSLLCAYISNAHGFNYYLNMASFSFNSIYLFLNLLFFICI